MLVPDRPGLGITLTDAARSWTVDRAVVDTPRQAGERDRRRQPEER
jgi:hypothetical protein